MQCTEEEAAVILRVLNEIKNETGIESILDVPEERELSNVYVTNKLMELLIHFTRFARKRDCRNEKGDPSSWTSAAPFSNTSIRI